MDSRPVVPGHSGAQAYIRLRPFDSARTEVFAARGVDFETTNLAAPRAEFAAPLRSRAPCRLW